MKVLVADRIAPAAMERLRGARLAVEERTGLAGAELAAALDGVHAIVIRSATRVTSEVLAAAPSLRLVVRAGTGLDNVDVGAARARGVAVFNTPNANAVSVAELTLGMLIALERHLAPAAASLAQGAWEKSKYQGREIAGRRLGIVGLGRIGREVARRARAFDMEVWACDPLLPAWPQRFDWVHRATLEEMLPRVDVLTVHVPLSEGTRGLIGAGAFSRLKPGAVLVNCSRGGVVEEDALLAALRSGALRGAAIDVFAHEPPGRHPLLELPQVLATPHLGASTREAQERAGLEAADIVISELAKLEV